jgi:RNA polymerase sigma factor (sigma-70 family)
MQVDNANRNSKSRTGHRPEQWVDRTLLAYYDDIHNSDLLTVAEERALFALYRTCTPCGYKFTDKTQELRKCPMCGAKRNDAARDRLVKGALLFVVRVAKGYARQAKGKNYDSDVLKSLVSAGNWGLLIAVDKFDLAKKTRFLTYAAWWIQERIRFELDTMGLVRVPVYRQKELRAKRKRGDSTKLDAPFVVLEELDVVDHSHHDDQLERNLINSYGTNAIHRSLRDLKLRGRDKYIALAYFGYRTEPKNLRQISRFLELSSERVRQIKKDVLGRLKLHLQSKRLHETEDILHEP